MSSFTMQINGADVLLEAAPGVNLERSKDSKVFKNWVTNLDPKLQVFKVTFQSTDYFGPRVGFTKIETVTTFQGVKIPGIALLRGGAVSILVILRCEGEEWVILTKQPRVPVGCSGLLELPAGMLDESGDFAGVAAKEMAEETGVKLRTADLIDLTAKAQPSSRGVYPSAGGCDEFLRLMFHERTVTRAELDAMRGKATGLLEEGEVIVLELVELKNLWRVCNDAKALSSLALYQNLRAAGEL